MTDKPISNQLTKDDVAKLMANPSAEVRAETTAKIAAQFEVEALSPAERQIAEDIFRKLVKDVEVRVREALAAHLKNSPDLPHDVAVALARDVDSVSLPMLKFSEVLTDEDLVEIVRDQGAAKQIAIAQRPSVSSRVADALIDTGNEKAVARLVANEGAKLTEQALDRVMEEYQESEAVSDSLSRRPAMPAAVSARRSTGSWRNTRRAKPSPTRCRAARPCPPRSPLSWSRCSRSGCRTSCCRNTMSLRMSPATSSFRRANGPP
jgi:uncharacterized protein (DUF2336 family)